jgi:O-antigen ligase
MDQRIEARPLVPRDEPAACRRPKKRASVLRGAETRAALLTLGGTLLTFTAPQHRLDLLAYGVLAMLGGLLWRPTTGPFVVGATLPVFFFSRQLVGPLSFSPPGLLLVLAWSAALVQAARSKLKLAWPTSAYDAPLGLFLVAALLSLLVSEYLILSVRELRALVLEPVLFFLLLNALDDRRAALSGFLLAASLTALVAIAQVVFGLGGTEAEGVRRAQAWYPQPNHLALMLGRALPFLLAAALVYRRAALWVGVGVVGLALLLTFSTGGWLGAGVASVVVVFALGWRRPALGIAGFGAAALVVVFGLALVGLLPERLNPLRQTGGFRLDLWLSSLEMVRDHPLLGIGPDNFAYLYQQVYLREGAAAESNLSHPHNWLLHFWLELGLAGLVAFGWLLVTFWRAAKQALHDSERRWLVAGALGAMADLLVHGAIDNSYFLVDLAFVFWMTLAVTRAAAVKTEC